MNDRVSQGFFKGLWGGGGQTKKKKVNHPKALCLDYLQLKETFGIDLETEVEIVENTAN